MIWFSASCNHQFAKLIRLACLAFTNDLSMRFEQADDLVRQLGESSENARLGLPHHAANTICHGREMLAQALHRSPTTPWQPLDFFQDSARIAQNLPRHVEKF